MTTKRRSRGAVEGHGMSESAIVNNSQENVVAWEVNIDSMRCFVFAATAPKARWLAVRGYWEAGYGRKGLWPNTSAYRAERYDNSPRRNEIEKCFSEEWL